MAEEKKLPLDFVVPDNLLSVFSDNLTVQHNQAMGVFILSFFQTNIPLAIDPAIEKIQSRCIARIVVTPNHMEKLVCALHDNLESYKKACLQSQEKS